MVSGVTEGVKEYGQMGKDIQMPKLFGKGCVLQKGEETRVWGWYEPGKQIVLEFQGNSYETFTSRDGRFEIGVKCKEAGGPFRMVLRGTDAQEKVLEGIYVGDVFVCAGQSNMELPMSRVRERFPEESEQNGCSGVHYFKVQECAEFVHPRKEHETAMWMECTGDHLQEVSALSYFYGKILHEERKLPIGIINLSLGGTPVQAWTSPEGLAAYPEMMKEKHRFEKALDREVLLKKQEKEEREWQQKLANQEETTADAEWKNFQLPGYFADQGLVDFNGVLYLKYSFHVREELEGQAALLRFGTMVDSDYIYINGALIGETGYCFPPRRYKIPANLLKAGENEIRIRLVCRHGKGRVTPDKPYEILFSSGERINLAGTWKYQVRGVCEPAPDLTFISRKPTGLFQGMVAPCLSATVKGIIWYQGESNEDCPEMYEELLKGLIRDWRKHWKQERLPFVIVQLPACGIDIAGNGAWAIIREAQKRAAQLPDTAMTVNLDLGESNDLHPVNKKDVAYRIFLAVQHLIYGENVVWQGPEPKRLKKTKRGLVLELDTKDGENLELINGKIPGEFEVAGVDNIFHPITPKIEGNKLIFSEETLGKDGVEKIQTIRYAWSDAPLEGLLCNRIGLPAAPFILNKATGTEGYEDEII